VAHVGIERLAAGGAEDHLGEHDKTGQSVVGQELEGVMWTDRKQHGRVGRDGNDTGGCQGREPEHHDRSEGAGNLVGPPGLQQEETDSDTGGDQD